MEEKEDQRNKGNSEFEFPKIFTCLYSYTGDRPNLIT